MLRKTTKCTEGEDKYRGLPVSAGNRERAWRLNDLVMGTTLYLTLTLVVVKV